MPCETITDNEGRVTAIHCSAPWGLGGKTYRWIEDGKEYTEEGYGMGGPPMDPHDFYPDGPEDGTTPEEMAAWEAAKAACMCGREISA